MTTADKLSEELKAFMKERSIGTFVVAFKDPDSDITCQISDGSYAWGIGACVQMEDLFRYRCVQNGGL
jgi:hypothetical protein